MANIHSFLILARKSKISLSLKRVKCNRLLGIGIFTVTMVLQLNFRNDGMQILGWREAIFV